MPKLIIGIIMIIIGIIGGYLAKDGWNEIKGKNKAPQKDNKTTLQSDKERLTQKTGRLHQNLA